MEELRKSPATVNRRSTRNTGSEAALGRGVLAIAGLSSLALAQPVYDLLRRAPEFFAIRGLSINDLLALTVALAVGPPLILSAPAAAVRLFRPVWVRPAIAAPAGLLVAVITLQAGRNLPATAVVVLAAVIGAAVAWAYVRLPAARYLALVLSGATVLVPAILVLDSDVRRSASARSGGASVEDTGARASIVMVIFDEWSLTSILDSQGRIDRQRLPNLSRLADTATWYPNATAAANMTNHAVPAILTGQPPEKGRLPTGADHPVNLFTLLAKSHDLFVSEAVATLCPPDLNLLLEPPAPFADRFGLLAADLSLVWLGLTLPAPWREGLPAVTDNWSGFDRRRSRAEVLPASEQDLARAQPHRRNSERVPDFRRFIDSIKPPGARPGLYFMHSLLPHAGWEYLPSGRRYLQGRVHGFSDGTWTDSPWPVRYHRKRYLLQVEFVDRLIGDLTAKLESQGLFDRSLVVITADHGLSFQPGRSRRLPELDDPSGDHLLDLVSVPLIVKAPFQDRAEIDDAPYSLVDLMPNMLRLAGADPRTVAQRSPGRVTPLLLSPHSVEFEIPNDRERWRRTRIAEQTDFLGESNDPVTIGTVPGLHGRRLSEVPTREGEVRARLDAPRLWDDVDVEAAVLPVVVRGFLIGQEAPADSSVVVALNGVVADSVRPYAGPRGRSLFAAMLPEAGLRPGPNQVELFLALDQVDGPILERLEAPRLFVFQEDPAHRYEALRESEGWIRSLLRRSVRRPDQAPLRFPVKPQSQTIRGFLDAAVLLPDAAPGNRSYFELSGRLADTAEHGGRKTLVAVTGGHLTAFVGIAFESSGFSLRVAADRQQVEREGIVAYAIGHKGVATRVGFSYQELESGRDGVEIMPTSDGRRLPVRSPGGSFDGAVDLVAAAGKSTRISGWAADLERGEAPRQVVVYRDGKFLTTLGRANRERPDVVERYEDDPRLLRTGFRGLIHGGPLPSTLARRHRVFAVMERGAAVELPIN